MLKLNQRAFSLVETMTAVAVLSVTTLTFASLWSQTANNAGTVSRKSASIDVERSVRALFKNATSCKCSFSNIDVSPGFGGGNVSVTTGLKYYNDTTCTAATSKNLATVGQALGSASDGLKATAIDFVNVRQLPDNYAVADLQISYTQAGQAQNPVLVRSIMFKTDAANKITDCVDSGTTGGPVNSKPYLCGDGKICMAGKSIAFTGDGGGAVAASLSAINSNTNVDAYFVDSSGRRMYLNIQMVGGNLQVTPKTGWKPQFCYTHVASSHPCDITNSFSMSSIRHYNCESALYWQGDFNGNTKATQVLCGFSASTSGIPSPIVPTTIDHQVVDCRGVWGDCLDASNTPVYCGASGLRQYHILSPAAPGGNACPYPDGALENCSGQSCVTCQAYPDETPYVPPAPAPTCSPGPMPTCSPGPVPAPTCSPGPTPTCSPGPTPTCSPGPTPTCSPGPGPGPVCIPPPGPICIGPLPCGGGGGGK